MPLFVVIGIDDWPASVARRDALRPQHLAYVRKDHSAIRLVGPMLEDDGAISGSLYIFEAGSAADIRAWLADEPYANGRVYRELIVRGFEVRKNDLPPQAISMATPTPP